MDSRLCAAMVTKQRVAVNVNSQPRIAPAALGHPAALVAKQSGCEAASIDEYHYLIAPLQVLGHEFHDGL